MIIKVCGLRESENIHALEHLGIDMTGLDFRNDSPRYVSMIRSRAGIIPDYSEEMLKENANGGKSDVSNYYLRAKRVGVFADDMPQNIVTRVYNFRLDYVQLDGEESRIMIENLLSTLDPDIHEGIKIIKTISVSSSEDFENAFEYEGVADLLLFKLTSSNGQESISDTCFDMFVNYKGNIPFIVGGDIGMDNIDAIKDLRHDMFVGIDVNRCFETEIGIKDIDKIRILCDELKR